MHRNLKITYWYTEVIFMAEHFKEFVVILLSSFGILYLYKSLLVFLLRSGYDKKIYVIIPIDESCENIEQIVRSNIERCRLMGKSKWTKIICVDYGCEKEYQQILFLLCKEYPFLEYITAEEFSKRLSV